MWFANIGTGADTDTDPLSRLVYVNVCCAAWVDKAGANLGALSGVYCWMR